MYQSTIFGTSVRPCVPPNAVPFQTRPVTSWNGRVAISLPASCHPDHDGYAPAAVTGFPAPAASRWYLAGAVEGEVGAAVGQLDQVLEGYRRRPFRV